MVYVPKTPCLRQPSGQRAKQALNVDPCQADFCARYFVAFHTALLKRYALSYPLVYLTHSLPVNALCVCVIFVENNTIEIIFYPVEYCICELFDLHLSQIIALYGYKDFLEVF